MGFWTDVASAAIGSAAGALAGGFLAYIGGLKAAKLTTDAVQEADERHWAREQARRDRESASALLSPLANFRLGVPFMAKLNHVPETVPLTVGDTQMAEQGMSNLIGAQLTIMPQIANPQLRERFKVLLDLAKHLMYEQATPALKKREYADIETYLQYVQLSVEALVQGRELPAPVDPPEPLRKGLDPWEPEPRPENWT